MKTGIFTLLVCFFIACTPEIIAQKGIDDGSRYGHGDDSINCVTNLSLYREYVRQREYVSAVKYWRPAFRECPTSTKNLYIDGVKIYKDFIEKEKNTGVQSGLIDTLMMIYHQRIKYYPADRVDQRGRQGVDLLRYRRNDAIKYVQEAYDYLKESITLGKAKSSEAVVATFFTSSVTLFQNDQHDESRIIDDYILCSNILEAKLKIAPDDKTLSEIKNAQDLNFQGVGVSCEKLIAKLEPLFINHEKDISNLRVITSALRISGCTNNTLFYQAAKNFDELVPSAESAVNIAAMAYDKGNYTESAEYFKKAIQLESDSEKRANYLLGLSKTLYKLNKKSDSRESALKALELKPNWGEPYIVIGQLYAESASDCSNISLPKAFYWVAVDKFIRAKVVDPSCEEQVNRLILSNSDYFPNKEDAFFLDIHEGDSYTVNCWINETTKVRF